MFAVVGHLEWISFVHVAELPQAGQILPATDFWEEVGGGGAVAAAQLARLAGTAHFFTALGDDEVGRRCFQRLCELGLTVHAAWRQQPQRRALVYLDGAGERTITVIGPRLEPQSSDELPWHLLDECRGCYFTGGAFVEARRAASLVATTRIRSCGVRPDAWVGSCRDPREAVAGDLLGARLLAMTDGSRGGRYWTPAGEFGWAATQLPGEPVDAYGCGDSFAGGLAYGLGSGLSDEEAIKQAARCGAACRCLRGPYGS
ncbi:MAG: ribokinase [Candidatus Eremiobacteraeota bacterium]|nr:ribokinase [Candidatus Eremiobacteraeota bacterium]MCW5866195.1 ribokinase [Candidatus Eremiobacteraeota bacterium]